MDKTITKRLNFKNCARLLPSPLPTFFSLPCAEGGLTHECCKLFCPPGFHLGLVNGESENGKEMTLGYLFP